MLVQAIRHDAAGCYRRHEGFRGFDAMQRGLEVFDVAPDQVLPLVGNRAGARPIALGADETLGFVILGIEFGKPFAVPSFGDDLAGLETDAGALLEAGEAFENVARPACRLAKLAVADDVDADVGLLADDPPDGFAQPR